MYCVEPGPVRSVSRADGSMLARTRPRSVIRRSRSAADMVLSGNCKDTALRSGPISYSGTGAPVFGAGMVFLLSTATRVGAGFLPQAAQPLEPGRAALRIDDVAELV